VAVAERGYGYSFNTAENVLEYWIRKVATMICLNVNDPITDLKKLAILPHGCLHIDENNIEKYYPLTVPPKNPVRKKFSHAFLKELVRMQETPIDAMRKRDELKAKRNLLFQRFLRNPLETHLALKIKTIDDQVAKCTELMERKLGPTTKLDSRR
jgi:hypothetical protein